MSALIQYSAALEPFEGTHARSQSGRMLDRDAEHVQACAPGVVNNAAQVIAG